MNAAVAVRRGTIADRDFVRDLGRRTADASVSALRSGPREEILAAFDRLLTFVYERRHDLLVAADGDAPVGFILSVYDLPDEVTGAPQAFIAYTAVEPDARRRGIARSLLEAAEALARAQGLRHVSLMVTEENAAARALYDRTGFATERRMMTKDLA